MGREEAGESLLPSEQQKAIKTNRRTSLSDFPAVCLEGGGRQVKGCKGIIFQGRRLWGHRGRLRVCEWISAGYTHEDDRPVFVPPLLLLRPRWKPPDSTRIRFVLLRTVGWNNQPLASFKNSLARSRDYEVHIHAISMIFYTTFLSFL